MTSVRNHLLQLSGNKWIFIVCTALLAAACSPKVRPVSAPAKKENPVKTEPEKASAKPGAQQVSTIAMLLPFNLDNLNAGAQYTSGTLSRANLSLDYYQGFKLALDSLAAKGYNYKLQVFDAKDQPSQAHSFAYNPAIRSSDLIVGPVFPDDLHDFTSILTGTGKSIPTVSPLSPAAPSTIKDQDLITVATPLEYHAWAAAQYIQEHYKPKKIFILKSGFSEENNYITPLKKGTDSLSKRKTRVITATIVRGQINSLIPQLSLTEENIFVIAATNQPFLVVTLHSLDSLAKKYPITLFGHPSWGKFSYLKPDILQRLKTHITSTDRVDYKAPEIVAFIRNYKKAYHVEPSEYALMGFDEGLYFGGLLEDKDGLKKLDKTDFAGLLNNYHFVKKPGIGWVNTHVNVLKYSNFELKKVE
ncbi:MAG: amino acid transporter substrate-binding protein [Mucilaginibacter sp.]|nr:amino acid transporter substrate-binding protein [Mucilaginibacter sp.]